MRLLLDCNAMQVLGISKDTVWTCSTWGPMLFSLTKFCSEVLICIL